MKRYAIGADPGSPVALALLSPAGKLINAVSWEDVGLHIEVRGKTTTMWANEPALIASVINQWMEDYTTLPPVMVIEAAAPRPGEGIVSSCKYVGSQYMLRGIAAGLGIPYQVVAPSKWKRDLGLLHSGTGAQAKEASRAKALAIWPDKAALLKRKKDHNLAEAALMGLWGTMHGVFSE